MEKERKKILWLVSWYPNRYDLFDGDFIQRHAKAAALYDDIHVLFVKQHLLQESEEQVFYDEGGLTEQIIYLPKKKGTTGKVWNVIQWWQSYTTHINQLIRQNNFFLVHVHVPWKAGLLAMWLKRKYGLNYLVTEHWGIYNKTVEDNIHRQIFPVRFLLRKIYREASAFLTVSRFLGEGVNQTLIKKDYTIIPNVVETTQFCPATAKHSRFTFLHVSNMVALKNVDGIIEAFQQFLRRTGADAQLILIGNRNDRYKKMLREIEAGDTRILFLGEVPYNRVAKEMQKAHVLVLNSDMENSPCVIGEALCTGLPVIATHVGGIPELLSTDNSLLVPPRKNEALSCAMQKMKETYTAYEPEKIAIAAASRFSMTVVGRQLHLQYHVKHRLN